MSKTEVLNRLKDDLANPGSTKSGEFLQQRVLCSVRMALSAGDRHGVIEVMQDWLKAREDPLTLLAVTVASECHLVELFDGLAQLKTEVEQGQHFQKFYLKWIDAALTELKQKRRE